MLPTPTAGQGLARRIIIEQASLCTAARVGGDLGGHVYNFARNDWPERQRFYIKIGEFQPKKHDFLMLRHLKKPRAKNNKKSDQKAMQAVSSFGSLFRYFGRFSDLFFSCFFR